MPAQHEDPLVYNDFTGSWQNASNSQASGNPVGVTVGPPGGSTVRMAPEVGSTLQIDGSLVVTIETAFQMSTGAVSENIPAYSCSVVGHQGLGNEQIGHLLVSGLASNSAQATVMLSEAADGSQLGFTKHGTVTPGAGAITYAFATLHAVFPRSMLMQYAQGFGLFGTDTGGTASGWKNMGMINGFSTGSTGEFRAQYRFSPLHDGVVFFRGVVLTPASGNVNGVNFTNVAAGYTPAGANNCRWVVISLTSAGSMGYCVLNSDTSINFRGLPAQNNASIDITGHTHISNNPAG